MRGTERRNTVETEREETQRQQNRQIEGNRDKMTETLRS